MNNFTKEKQHIEKLEKELAKLKLQIESRKEDKDEESYPLGFYTEGGTFFFNDIYDGYGYAANLVRDCREAQAVYAPARNSFKTKKGADIYKRQQDAYYDLVMLIKKLNQEKGWVCDWEDTDQQKFSFRGRHGRKFILGVDYEYDLQILPTELYFFPKIGSIIIDQLGKEKIIFALYGIE